MLAPLLLSRLNAKDPRSGIVSLQFAAANAVYFLICTYMTAPRAQNNNQQETGGLRNIRFGVDSKQSAKPDPPRIASLTPVLPTPSPQTVEQFQKLYLKKYGVTLDTFQSLELATRVLQVFYVQQALRALRQKVRRER